MAIDDLLTRGVDEVIVKSDLANKLKEGGKLRIKYGIDPNKPDIHLGHAVPIRKLKAFQDLGHTAVFIVGDYTARIGDPSEKEKTREPIAPEIIKKNADIFFKEAFRILDKEKTEIHLQSEWYKDFDLKKVIEVGSKVSTQQIMEHETFKKRLEESQPFMVHEIIYPLLQGYDSVAIKADVEIGGTDQKFNLLMGRQIQKAYNQPQQDILMMKYLIGLDGKEKMSKSLGNYIAIDEAPGEMYGKVMSIPDNLIMQYYELCTDVSNEDLKGIENKIGSNPRNAKADLAKIIVEMYHSKDDAEKAASEFDRVFSRRERPKDIPEVKLEISECRMDDLLVKCELATSKSEARRLLEQGAVEIEGETIIVPEKVMKIQDGMIIQVGKRRFVKIKKE